MLFCVLHSNIHYGHCTNCVQYTVKATFCSTTEHPPITLNRFYYCIYARVIDGTRTHNNRNHNPVLYRLNYDHHERGDSIRFFSHVNPRVCRITLALENKHRKLSFFSSKSTSTRTRRFTQCSLTKKSLPKNRTTTLKGRGLRNYSKAFRRSSIKSSASSIPSDNRIRLSVMPTFRRSSCGSAA